MTVEERAIADVIDLRRLIMCIALLERVHGVGGTMALTLSGLERSIEFRGQFHPGRNSDGSDHSICKAEGTCSSREGSHQPWPLLSDRQGLFIFYIMIVFLIVIRTWHYHHFNCSSTKFRASPKI